MINHRGNMWNVFNKADYFICTGNSCIKTNNSLVMGIGMAKEFRDKFTSFDELCGASINLICGHLGFYGFLKFDKLGIFQVKYHFLDNAEIKIIQRGVRILRKFALSCPSKQIHMNYPGIGYGRLSKKIVAPKLRFLPDNVHIWRY